jgi:hypothetical protein
MRSSWGLISSAARLHDLHENYISDSRKRRRLNKRKAKRFAAKKRKERDKIIKACPVRRVSVEEYLRAKNVIPVPVDLRALRKTMAPVILKQVSTDFHLVNL